MARSSGYLSIDSSQIYNETFEQLIFSHLSDLKSEDVIILIITVEALGPLFTYRITNNRTSVCYEEKSLTEEQLNSKGIYLKWTPTISTLEELKNIYSENGDPSVVGSFCESWVRIDVDMEKAPLVTYEARMINNQLNWTKDNETILKNPDDVLDTWNYTDTLDFDLTGVEVDGGEVITKTGMKLYSYCPIGVPLDFYARPINSVYITSKSGSPNNDLGGRWIPIGQKAEINKDGAYLVRQNTGKWTSKLATLEVTDDSNNIITNVDAYLFKSLLKFGNFTAKEYDIKIRFSRPSTATSYYYLFEIFVKENSSTSNAKATSIIKRAPDKTGVPDGYTSLEDFEWSLGDVTLGYHGIAINQQNLTKALDVNSANGSIYVSLHFSDETDSSVEETFVDTGTAVFANWLVSQGFGKNRNCSSVTITLENKSTQTYSMVVKQCYPYKEIRETVQKVVGFKRYGIYFTNTSDIEEGYSCSIPIIVYPDAEEVRSARFAESEDSEDALYWWKKIKTGTPVDSEQMLNLIIKTIDSNENPISGSKWLVSRIGTLIDSENISTILTDNTATNMVEKNSIVPINNITSLLNNTDEKWGLYYRWDVGDEILDIGSSTVSGSDGISTLTEFQDNNNPKKLGVYYVSQTTVPAGYNKAQDFIIVPATSESALRIISVGDKETAEIDDYTKGSNDDFTYNCALWVQLSAGATLSSGS